MGIMETGWVHSSGHPAKNTDMAGVWGVRTEKMACNDIQKSYTKSFSTSSFVLSVKTAIQ